VWKSLSLGGTQIPETFIIECNRCSGLTLAAAYQKTKTCPYCGAKLELHRTRHLAKASNAFEASEILRRIKAERQSNARKNSPK
jgi:transcription initiation factor IIE alpha subunit